MATIQYPSNLDELIGWGATCIMFIFHKRPDSEVSIPDDDLGVGAVMMPVPKNLENPMDISWEQTALGQIGNAVRGGATNYDSIIKSMKGSIGGNIMEALGGDKSKAEAAIGLKDGQIANPYMAMTFKSIGFRKFSMEFRFTPHNIGECNSIDLIVKKFRKTALPTVGGRIGYPGEIDISYISSRGYWLPKFKRSVIEDVQVSYSGQGHYAQMDNGFPAETVLNIKFTENVLVDRDDITTGYSY